LNCFYCCIIGGSDRQSKTIKDNLIQNDVIILLCSVGTPGILSHLSAAGSYMQLLTYWNYISCIKDSHPVVSLYDMSIVVFCVLGNIQKVHSEHTLLKTILTYIG